MSEFCRSRCVEKMDVKITRINCLTGGHPTAAMLPLDYATDRECLDDALPTIGLTEPPRCEAHVGSQHARRGRSRMQRRLSE